MSDATQPLDARRRMFILRAHLALRRTVIGTVLRVCQHPEIIIERVIFLHRDDDVIHLRETIRARSRGVRTLRAHSDRQNRTHDYTHDISLHGFLRRAERRCCVSPTRARVARSLLEDAGLIKGYWRHANPVNKKSAIEPKSTTDLTRA